MARVFLVERVCTVYQERRPEDDGKRQNVETPVLLPPRKVLIKLHGQSGENRTSDIQYVHCLIFIHACRPGPSTDSDTLLQPCQLRCSRRRCHSSSSSNGGAALQATAACRICRHVYRSWRKAARRTLASGVARISSRGWPTFMGAPR